MPRRMLPALVAAVMLIPVAAPAGFIAEESFSYPDRADLQGRNGGTGFATPWAQAGFAAQTAANFDVIAGSLTASEPSLASFPTAGNHVATPAQAAITGIGRLLSNPLTTGTYYISMLIGPDGPVGDGAFGGFFGLYLDSAAGDANDLFFGKPGTRSQWSLETRGGTGQSASNFTAVSGRTDLLVLKADLRPGDDEFTLWVNRPLGGGDPPSFDARKVDLDVGTVSGLVLYGTGSFAADEIRIGTTYADVTVSPAAVPEPSSVALLGLVGTAGGFASWRKRRKAAV